MFMVLPAPLTICRSELSCKYELTGMGMPADYLLGILAWDGQNVFSRKFLLSSIVSLLGDNLMRESIGREMVLTQGPSALAAFKFVGIGKILDPHEQGVIRVDQKQGLSLRYGAEESYYSTIPDQR